MGQDAGQEKEKTRHGAGYEKNNMENKEEEVRWESRKEREKEVEGLYTCIYVFESPSSFGFMQLVLILFIQSFFSSLSF